MWYIESSPAYTHTLPHMPPMRCGEEAEVHFEEKSTSRLVDRGDDKPCDALCGVKRRVLEERKLSQLKAPGRSIRFTASLAKTTRLSIDWTKRRRGRLKRIIPFNKSALIHLEFILLEWLDDSRNLKTNTVCDKISSNVIPRK